MIFCCLELLILYILSNMLNFAWQVIPLIMLLYFLSTIVLSAQYPLQNAFCQAMDQLTKKHLMQLISVVKRPFRNMHAFFSKINGTSLASRVNLAFIAIMEVIINVINIPLKMSGSELLHVCTTILLSAIISTPKDKVKYVRTTLRSCFNCS